MAQKHQLNRKTKRLFNIFLPISRILVYLNVLGLSINFIFCDLNRYIFVL